MNVAHPLQSLRAIGGTVDALLRLSFGSGFWG
jgi:hypothetical protein